MFPRRPRPKSLAVASEPEFYSALSQLHARAMRGRAGSRFVAMVAIRLAKVAELPPRVKEERLRAVIHRASLDDAGLRHLATYAPLLPPALRNAIATFLSPPLRRSLTATPRQTVTPPRPDSVRPVIVSDGAGSANTPLAVPNPDGGAASESNSFSTVVLLSRAAHQDSNRSLLEKSGYGPLLWDTFDKLKSDLALNDDVCACVIDQSALQDLSPDKQRELFGVVAEYSTFLWIRVQEGAHLALSRDEIRNIVRTGWCLRERVPAENVSFQADSTIRSPELDDVRRARNALRARDRAQFVPGELTIEEARLLVAAARSHIRDLDPVGGPVVLETLETEFLKGGHTNARVARVRPNQGGRPVIAKIDIKDRILDEIRRFRHFIQRWDDRLRPEAFFHANAAVLLFGLVPDVADAKRPAEMLETRLRELWNTQIFGGDEAVLRSHADALGTAISNAAGALSALNSQRPGATDFIPLGNPPTAFFERWETSGLDWGLGEQANVARRNADKRFALLATCGVVHGDVHLGNVLVRGDSDAHLIDYAGSGPGHPALDLARLELALYLGPVRQMEPEVRSIAFQKSLSLGKSSASDLAADFPALHKAHINRACVQGCVAARDNALRAVGAHGGDERDYLAAKYLVAWQNLVMFGRSTGANRSVIAALAPEIASW